MIANFPRNPISSFHQLECTLGMYILWTIESIRAESVNKEYPVMRFPSQNPILALRNAADLNMIFDNQSQTAAAAAYYEWWEQNKNKNFGNFKDIDPLGHTTYKWH